MGNADDQRKRTRLLKQVPGQEGGVGSRGQLGGLALTRRKESSSSESRRGKGEADEGRCSTACGYDKREEVGGLQPLKKVRSRAPISHKALPYSRRR